MRYWRNPNFRNTITVEEAISSEAGGFIEYIVDNPSTLGIDTNSELYKFLEYINNKFPVNFGATRNIIDEHIFSHHSILEMLPAFAYESINKDSSGNYIKVVNMSAIAEEILNVLATNLYKYKTLLATTELDYNPIWNVDSEETSTEDRGARQETTFHGEKLTNYSTGQQTNYHNEGNKKETDVIGSQTDTLVRAEENNTNGLNVPEGAQGNIGKVETVTNYNTQMDNVSDWYYHDRSEKVTQGYTEFHDKSYGQNADGTNGDVSVKGGHTDTITQDAYQNTDVLGNRADSETVNPYNDTLNKNQYQDSIHIVRQGNIGTKTSQSMIKEEREIAKFNVIKIIAKDIVKEITFGIYY